MSDDLYLKEVPKTIHLDSHLPYLYMPTADYTHFGFVINGLYNKTETRTIWQGCSYSENYCRFNTSCEAAKKLV